MYRFGVSLVHYASPNAPFGSSGASPRLDRGGHLLSAPHAEHLRRAPSSPVHGGSAGEAGDGGEGAFELKLRLVSGSTLTRQAGS